MATSLKDYLKKYQSTEVKEKKPKSKLKKRKAAAAAANLHAGVIIVDNDSGWQKNIDEDSDDPTLEDGVDGPQVIEDVEVKRMHQMERLKQHRPYMSIGDDGSGWVPVSDNARDSSPPRRRRNDSPEDQELDRKPKAEPRRNARSPDLSPARRDPDLSRKPKVEKDDMSPPRRNALSPDPSPVRKHDHVPDLSPPRRMRGSPDQSLPQRKGSRQSGGDLSPPRRQVGNSDLSPPRRNTHNSDLSPPRKGRPSRFSDLSPPRRKATATDIDKSPDGLGKKLPRSDSPDMSPPRKRKPRFDSPDMSPPRRPPPAVSETNPIGMRRKQPQPHSPDMSPPRRKQPRMDSPDLSPPRKNLPLADSDINPNGIRKKVKMTDGRQAGLTSDKDLAAELAKKKRDEAKRMKEMDPSVSGRAAETVYRDKRGKRLEGLEELLRQQQGEAKVEVKPLEWGKGLAQKREVEQQQAEYDAEKSKPFARTRDDPELDKSLKERVRWGDPMAHLVKRKDPEAMLVDLGASEEMKESGFIIPQDVPKHSWLKRGLGAPMNRYGIRPGRHWDGVDRSTGFESQMFKAKAEKQANEMEAYMWSVADM